MLRKQFSLKAVAYSIRLVWSNDKIYFLVEFISNIISSFSAIVGILLLQQFVNMIMKRTFSFDEALIMIGIYCAYNMISSYISASVFMDAMPRRRQRVAGKIKKEIYNRCIQDGIENYDEPQYLDLLNVIHYVADEEIFSVFSAITGLLASCIAASTLVRLLGSINLLFIIFAFISAAISIFQEVSSSRINADFVEKKLNCYRKMNYVRRSFSEKKLVEELQVWNAKKLMIHQQDEANERLIQKIKMAGVQLKKIAFMGCIASNGILIAIFVLLTYQLYRGEVAMGNLVAAYMETAQLTAVIVSISSSIGYVYQHSLFFKTFMDYLNADLPEIMNHQEMRFKEIQVKNVSFNYPGHNGDVLAGIDFSIKAGMQIALVGINGAGKSTLAKLIGGMYQPTEGEILFDNVALNLKTRELIRGNCSFIFQDVSVFPVSIAENVLMRQYTGDVDDTDRVNKAIEFVGLSEKVKALPNGINTILTKEFADEGIVLSGGEMQKIALARAYAHPRALLVLDEPTAALDVISEKNVIEKIKDYFSDSIVIWISHRPECLTEMNYIFCLENGTIVESGTYEDLIKRKGTFYKMYQMEGK